MEQKTMHRTIAIATMLIGVAVLPACSSDDQIEEEVSHITNEGPYGGHSVQWYKKHWKAETQDQRRWCRQQKETAKPVQSCISANIGWKQGRADPETNPPRRWEDGPSD
jgi:hypothetical protein